MMIKETIYNTIEEFKNEKESKLNSLINGDCLEVMKYIADKSIDMILCDLPYQVTKNRWDVIIPFDKLWKQYERIIKDNGTIVLTASQPFTSALVMSNLKMFKQELIWKKNIASNFLNANRQHLMRHESIVIFSKKSTTFNKQFLNGLPYHQKRNGKDDTGNNYNKINIRTDTLNIGIRNPISILEFDRETGHHPTQKPVALMEYLIKTYSNENEIILDNCMGSGSTIIACKNLNRNFIGIEKDEKYFNVAINRILNHNNTN